MEPDSLAVHGFLHKKASELKEFVGECKYAFVQTKKPSSTEFKRLLWISGAGIGILGLLGYVISLIKIGIVRLIT